ncbi:hypothetical protein EC973_006267 [Apophysomyces ossiformis]|uniref:Protein FAR1-RELATED SEQUENCE n=1 Tax=Apophysomyces ossiformis TaxID=679940 RepID=A0A8H7BWF7_9FUNG|nr:hypothetical protein EC973_006267 [Apophysomyces ossiformis]
MNALGIVFHENRKLLCTWYMMTNIEKNLSGKFKEVEVKKTCADLVKDTIESQTLEQFNQALRSFRKLARDESLYLENAKGNTYSYFEAEWLSCVEKWAGFYTRQLKHFGCTTTQRVESGQRALKRNLVALRPLDETEESTETDVLLLSKKYLQNLYCHVSKRALIALYFVKFWKQKIEGATVLAKSGLGMEYLADVTSRSKRFRRSMIFQKNDI